MEKREFGGGRLNRAISSPKNKGRRLFWLMKSTICGGQSPRLYFTFAWQIFSLWSAHHNPLYYTSYWLALLCFVLPIFLLPFLCLACDGGDGGKHLVNRFSGDLLYTWTYLFEVIVCDC